MTKYRVLGEEDEVVNINGAGLRAGDVVELDENEESTKIALSEGQLEATEEPVTAPADEEESEEEETDEEDEEQE